MREKRRHNIDVWRRPSDGHTITGGCCKSREPVTTSAKLDFMLLFPMHHISLSRPPVDASSRRIMPPVSSPALPCDISPSSLINFKQTASLSSCSPWSSGTMSTLHATCDSPHSSPHLGRGSRDASWCPRHRPRLSCSLHVVSKSASHRCRSSPHLSRGRQSGSP